MNIAKINDDVLTSDDLVKWLKLSSRFELVMRDLIREKFTAAAAKKQGITVSTEDMQERADQYRRVHGLHRAKDTNQFLDSAGVSLEEFESYITDTLLSETMRAQLTAPAAIEEYFKLNSPKFDSVEISHIVVESEGKAKELVSILNDDPESFSEIAKEYSIAASAADGGRIGKVRRGALSADAEAKIFNASEGDLLGPFASKDGSYHEIFMINAKRPASLDEATAETIKGLVYDEWLESRAREHKIEV